MATFQAGKTYECRFITDADARCPITVLKRTAKTVTIQDPTNPQQVKRCTIQIDLGDGDEFIKPFGSYSMAPYCRARRVMA